MADNEKSQAGESPHIKRGMITDAMLDVRDSVLAEFSLILQLGGQYASNLEDVAGWTGQLLHQRVSDTSELNVRTFQEVNAIGIEGTSEQIRQGIIALYDAKMLTALQYSRMLMALGNSAEGKIDLSFEKYDRKLAQEELYKGVEKFLADKKVPELFVPLYEINMETTQGRALHILAQAQQHGLINSQNGNYSISLNKQNFDQFYNFARAVSANAGIEETCNMLYGALQSLQGQGERGLHRKIAHNDKGVITDFHMTFDAATARKMNYNFHEEIRQQERERRGPQTPSPTPSPPLGLTRERAGREKQ